MSEKPVICKCKIAGGAHYKDCPAVQSDGVELVEWCGYGNREDWANCAQCVIRNIPRKMELGGNLVNDGRTGYQLPAEWKEKERKLFNEKFDKYAFEYPRIRGEVADHWISRMEVARAEGYTDGHNRAYYSCNGIDKPMGVSQWMDYGKKYGYAKFFEDKITKELVEKFLEQEKAMFKVTGKRYIALNESSVESLERGERIVVPIRSLDFPSVRLEAPTLDDFNKHSIIIKRD